jgi:hypothetical protein
LSGITIYEYALGSSVGSNDIIDWTTVGADTTIRRKYRIEFRACRYVLFFCPGYRLGRNISAVATSDGLVIDIIPVRQRLSA